MIRLAFYPSYESFYNATHNINSNPQNSIFINSNGGAIKIKEYLQNLPTNVGFTRGNYFINQLKDVITRVCNNTGNSSYNRFFLNFTWGTASELQDIIDTFADFSFNFQISVSIPGNPGTLYGTVGEFAFKFPNTGTLTNALNNAGQDNFIHALTLYNIDYYNDSNDFDVCSGVNSITWSVGNSYYKFGLFNEDPYPAEPVDCEDLRTSEATQGVYITANWEDPLGNQLSEDYNLLFQPDSQITQGSISFTNQYQYMMGLKGVTCRFNRGVIRDTGYIKINGHIDAEIYKVDMLGNTLVPVFEDITENFIIQFTFEPCCDYPAVVSETYTDAVESLNEQGANLMMGKVVFDSIEWHGFALLEDYCCDDVTCDDDVKMESSEEPIYIGVGGGGENVDITCICDNLSLINDTLSAKFNALNGKMDSLIETIEDKDLTVSFDDCVCDNLGLIKDSIDDVVSEIHDKDMSPIVNNTIQPPVNNITVEPCSPVVTNPVNNITVEPCSPVVTNPVNNITVEPCSPVVTNPVNNITVPVPTVNVAGDTVNVNTDLTDLIDELHNDLVTKDSQGNDIGIAKIIKNKDMGSDIEVSITPNELLNYRKVIRDSLDEI